MSDDRVGLHRATVAVGHEAGDEFAGAIAPPIFQTAQFLAGSEHEYTRISNPTVAAFERRVALSRILVVWDLDLPGVRFFALLPVVLFDATGVLVVFPVVLARARLGELILALAAIAALLGLPGPKLLAAA